MIFLQYRRRAESMDSHFCTFCVVLFNVRMEGLLYYVINLRLLESLAPHKHAKESRICKLGKQSTAPTQMTFFPFCVKTHFVPLKGNN